MDPISIVGLVGSIVNIVDVIAKSTKRLCDLQQKWNAADWTVSSLIGQLSTLSTALCQIQKWMSSGLSKQPQHGELGVRLSDSLNACWSLVNFMHDHLLFLDWTEANSLTSLGKMKAIFHDSEIRECAAHLDRQTNALNLLLTALNWYVIPFGLTRFQLLSFFSDSYLANHYQDSFPCCIPMKIASYWIKSRMILHR